MKKNRCNFFFEAARCGGGVTPKIPCEGGVMRKIWQARGVMQFPTDTPPNLTSPPYPLKNERFLRNLVLDAS